MTDLATTSDQAEAKGGWGIKRIAVAATLSLAGIVILIFLGALVLAINDVERAGQIVQLLRDYLIIVIVLESILILFAFAVLIMQIARSINLVQTEVKPVLDSAQEATSTVKGTAEFVSKHAVEPLVRILSFFAGLRVFLRELGGIRRAIRREKKG